MRKLTAKKAYSLLKRREFLKRIILQLQETVKAGRNTEFSDKYLAQSIQEKEELEKQLEEYGDFL